MLKCAMFYNTYFSKPKVVKGGIFYHWEKDQKLSKGAKTYHTDFSRRAILYQKGPKLIKPNLVEGAIFLSKGAKTYHTEFNRRIHFF